MRKMRKMRNWAQLVFVARKMRNFAPTRKPVPMLYRRTDKGSLKVTDRLSEPCMAWTDLRGFRAPREPPKSVPVL